MWIASLFLLRLLLLTQVFIRSLAFSVSISDNKHHFVLMSSSDSASLPSPVKQQRSHAKSRKPTVPFSGDTTTVYSGTISSLKPTFGFIAFSPNASSSASVYFQLSQCQDISSSLQKGNTVSFTLAADSQGRSYAMNIRSSSVLSVLSSASISISNQETPSMPANSTLQTHVTMHQKTDNVTSRQPFQPLQSRTMPPPFDGPSSGFRANVAWRAVDMDDLRMHPLFQALEEPHSVQVRSAHDFSRFRQDSWQWDALHRGRLTTSRAAACLGFYEEKAGKAMMIPTSLLGHGRTIDCWEALLETAPQDWTFLDESKNAMDVESPDESNTSRNNNS